MTNFSTSGIMARPCPSVWLAPREHFYRKIALDSIAGDSESLVIRSLKCYSLVSRPGADILVLGLTRAIVDWVSEKIEEGVGGLKSYVDRLFGFQIG